MAEENRNTLILEGLTLSDALTRMQGATVDWALALGLSDRAQSRLRLVLEELVTNSFKHGMVADASAAIRIDIAATEDGCQIEYRDDASPFSPELTKIPDGRDLPVEDRPVGRLGWVLILTFFELKGCETFEGGNLYRFASRDAFYGTGP